MHEKTTPALAPATTEGSLADLPLRHRINTPDRHLFGVRDGAVWRDITAKEFADQVDALAKGFLAAGVTPGSAVAIMSRTRYEWTLTDFALWAAGAIPVPIYETSSPDQVEWILKDSGAIGVVLETEKHASALASVSANLPDLAHTWLIDNGDLDTLAASGTSSDDSTLTTARADIDRHSVATIIYTSGTTGRPKGVELTHGNFLDLTENTVEKLKNVVAVDGASTLLFLPLAHVFARLIEVLCVQAGAKMAHSADIK
ncbi:MAG: AMP-binding protein, partial [Knoellia sp.]